MNIIDLNKLIFDKPASELKKQVEALSHQNLKNIIETSKSSFAMPLTLQSIICMLISFNYKIPVTTMAALYQLYANDLVVIAMTVLSAKNLEQQYINNSKAILNMIKTKQEKLPDSVLEFYNLLKHNIFEDKIYVSSDLW